MSRRDKNDEEWALLRDEITKRDKGKCQLCNILTPFEAHLFYKSNPQLEPLDPAHTFPVSTHPAECYNYDNVHLLCRSHHHRLDDYISPITGNKCSNNRHYWYWWRIITQSTENYDESIDYRPKVEALVIKN